MRKHLSFDTLEPRWVPSGLTPAQVRHAYQVDQVNYGARVPGDGRGQTIAIVDAFDCPTITQDLKTFDRAFGVPAPPSFRKVTPQGQPPYDPGWSLEIALDVEWAHAIAPGADLVLVEAADSGLNLLAATRAAAALPAVSVVSLSWGGPEFAGQDLFSRYFAPPAGHRPVTFTAASGDEGAVPIWPSTTSEVLSVGGTTLLTRQNGSYVREATWSGAGGGPSAQEPRPAWQQVPVPGSTRATPDVAFDGDPNTGVLVFEGGSLVQVGGTSVGAPTWAGIVAIADQGRALHRLPTLSTAQTASALYKASQGTFHDVTRGSSGYPATRGYDLGTGLGTPDTPRVVGTLVKAPRTARGVGGRQAGPGAILGGWRAFPQPIPGREPWHADPLVSVGGLVR